MYMTKFYNKIIRLYELLSKALLNTNYKSYGWKATKNLNIWEYLDIPFSFNSVYILQGIEPCISDVQGLFSTDQISGIEINNSKWSFLLNLKNKKGLDVKFLWDLSRFQFIEFLHEFKHPEDLQNHAKNRLVFLKYIKNFKRFNKPYCGANWMCTMDVAIRAVNILYLKSYYNTVQNNDDYNEEINDLLINHLFYIRKNLEWVPKKRGNHYLSNVCGILILASSFDLTNDTKLLLDFAINQFVKELELQVNEDGSYFENSTGYHRLYLEMLFYTLIFIEASSLEIRSFLFESLELKYKKGENFKEFIEIYFHPLLRKGILFAKAITLPDGTFHQIGDNDSGRFINRDNVWVGQYKDKYYNTNIRNSFYSVMSDIDLYLKRWYLDTSTQLFDLNFSQHKYSKDSLVKFNSNNIAINNGLNLERFSFSGFGLYGFRNDKFYLGFRCGFDKKSKTVHAHEDQLSFEIHDEENVNLVYKDKGSFTYTRDIGMRNLFRSSKSHLVPVFSDIAQGKSSGVFNFEYNGEFYLNNFAENSIEGIWVIDDRVILREIIIESDNVVINDYVNRENMHLVRPNSWSGQGLKFSPEYNVKIDL
ncbi:hypothetical protein AMR72_13880 [Flavobacterium psychrophilum]|nr:hypothetical protein AMR72_13880 [Flavobacterium psychrophilum]AOE53516.1 hypothetical protein ALW18_13870 [Flavobacterium psychrophilum]